MNLAVARLLYRHRKNSFDTNFHNTFAFLFQIDVTGKYWLHHRGPHDGLILPTARLMTTCRRQLAAAHGDVGFLPPLIAGDDDNLGVRRFTVSIEHLNNG